MRKPFLIQPLNLFRKSTHRLERFSVECRKVIGFALSTGCDWLKRFAPPFHPIRSKTKANCDALARFSRALRQPHVITSSFDWFNVLSVSYVIGQSNYFGFGFTTLKRKPLYQTNYSNKRKKKKIEYVDKLP